MRLRLPKLGTWLVLVGAARPTWGAPAQRQPQPLTLAWQAPEGCPGHAEVEQEIGAALSHLRGRGAVEVAAEVKPRESEPGFWLSVKVTHAGQAGERVLPIEDCRDAARAAALLVALSVENLPQVVKAEPPVTREPPAPAALPATERPRFSVGLGPRLVMGIGPELSAGAGFSLAYSRAFWRLSGRGAAFAESHHTVAGTPVGGTFQLLTAGVFACAGQPAAVTWYGCLGGRVDQLAATGTGASRTSSATTRVGSLAAGVTLEWSLPRRLLLRGELEAGYPLGAARFVITNQPRPVHEVGGVRGEAGLELAVAF